MVEEHSLINTWKLGCVDEGTRWQDEEATGRNWQSLDGARSGIWLLFNAKKTAIVMPGIPAAVASSAPDDRPTGEDSPKKLK